jgi:hypothetical protein
MHTMTVNDGGWGANRRSANGSNRDCAGPLGDCLEIKNDNLEIVEEPLFNAGPRGTTTPRGPQRL